MMNSGINERRVTFPSDYKSGKSLQITELYKGGNVAHIICRYEANPMHLCATEMQFSKSSGSNPVSSKDCLHPCPCRRWVNSLDDSTNQVHILGSDRDVLCMDCRLVPSVSKIHVWVYVISKIIVMVSSVTHCNAARAAPVNRSGGPNVVHSCAMSHTIRENGSLWMSIDAVFW